MGLSGRVTLSEIEEHLRIEKERAEIFLTVVSLLPLLLVDLLDGPELLLELHPPVLEPDLDLALGQAERVGDLYAPPPGEIMVKMELLLQLQGLEPINKYDKLDLRYYSVKRRLVQGSRYWV